MAELLKSTFSDWTRLKLKKAFGLQRVGLHTTLTQWLTEAKQQKCSETDRQKLAYLRDYATLGIDSWTEEEVKQAIISPIFSLIRFEIADHQTKTILAQAFAGRELRGEINHYQLKGYPDGLIAKGWETPEIPYFCLQEYKKEVEPSKDGWGQLLAAMLVAYQKNTKKRPIYGALVLGRNWFFLVLEDKKYSISNEYVVTKDDIFDIYRILQQLKLYVIQFLEEDKDLP